MEAHSEIVEVCSAVILTLSQVIHPDSLGKIAIEIVSKFLQLLSQLPF